MNIINTGSNYLQTNISNNTVKAQIITNTQIYTSKTNSIKANITDNRINATLTNSNIKLNVSIKQKTTPTAQQPQQTQCYEGTTLIWASNNW